MGSGLHVQKLADTIIDLGQKTESRATLVCHAPDNENGWVQLTAVPVKAPPQQTENRDRHWQVLAGYPKTEPPEQVLQQGGITLPEGSEITVWKARIYFALTMPGSTNKITLATLVREIMTRIQQVEKPDDVIVLIEETQQGKNITEGRTS